MIADAALVSLSAARAPDKPGRRWAQRQQLAEQRLEACPPAILTAGIELTRDVHEGVVRVCRGKAATAPGTGCRCSLPTRGTVPLKQAHISGHSGAGWTVPA